MIEVLGIVLFLVIAVWIWTVNWDEWCDIVGTILLNLLCDVLLAFVIFLLMCGAYKALEYRKENITDITKIETKSIYNLRNTDNISGRFSIVGGFFMVSGSGSVETVERYYSYIKTESGSLKRMYFDADKTEIIMNSEKPYVEKFKHYTYIKPGIWSLCDVQEVNTRYSYKLYVPKNTVIEKVDIR